MKGELGLHLHKEVLNLPIFEEATQGCLRSIALHTRKSFCAPGEFLVHKGDASSYLYLLVSGSMEILKMDMVVAILGKRERDIEKVDFSKIIILEKSTFMALQAVLFSRLEANSFLYSRP